MIFPLNWLALRQAVSSGLVRPQLSKYYDKKNLLSTPWDDGSIMLSKKQFSSVSFATLRAPSLKFPSWSMMAARIPTIT